MEQKQKKYKKIQKGKENIESERNNGNARKKDTIFQKDINEYKRLR